MFDGGVEGAREAGGVFNEPIIDEELLGIGEIDNGGRCGDLPINAVFGSIDDGDGRSGIGGVGGWGGVAGALARRGGTFRTRSVRTNTNLCMGRIIRRFR